MPVTQGVTDELGLLLAAGLLLGGCNRLDKDRVEVTVMVPKAAPSRTFSEVSVISGGDKFTWAQISSGQQVSVRLSPGDTSDAQVTLIYKADGVRKYWESSPLPSGRSYEVFIEIDAQARANGRSCIAPCDLSPR
jgi:hypothetical protein